MKITKKENKPLLEFTIRKFIGTNPSLIAPYKANNGNGNRTHICTLKGCCPNHLDDAAIFGSLRITTNLKKRGYKL